MPPIREHEVLYEDEDDDMPPLVDYPIQYTFLTDIPPPDSADSIPPSSALPESSFSIFASTPPDSPLSPDDASSTMTPSSTYRGSHGKKRDASYIPRPPNAFILYRSSFIRSQQITGKVEGNHSNLSKIIGMCWKALSREDRKAWEEKAVTAQAEHRKRYPDWRFRPGANAMARLKFKDGGGGPTRRGHTRVKVPPDRGGGEDDEPGAVLDDLDAEEMSGKAKGKAVTRGRERKTKTKKQIEKEKTASQRHVKIKDFLVEGKTPAELEAAIAEWDRETKGRDDKDKDHEKSGNAEASSSSASPFSAHQPHLSIQEDLVEHIASSLTPDTVSEGAFPPSSSSETYRNRPFDNNPQRSRSRSPDNPPHYHVTSLSKVPLTHMFKRSLSAPAPHHRSSYPSEALTHANNHPLRQVMMPVDTPPTLYEGTSHVPPHAHGHGPGHIRRDTISLPIHSSEYLFAQSHNDLGFRDIERSLSWQEEEDRRRVESAQEHGYWWTGSADEDEDDMYEPRREGSFEMGFNISTEGMGYDETATSSFDQAYLEEGFPSHPVNNLPRDAGHGVNWTNVPGRHGLVAVVQDPFMHSKRGSGSSTPSKTPPPPIPVPVPASSPIRRLSPNILLSATHDSRGDYDYYAPFPSLSPHSPVPASTFSTLAGWDGMPKSVEASGSRERPSPWLPDARWGIQPLGLRGGLGVWNEGEPDESRAGLASGMQVDVGTKVTFEEEGIDRYRYRSPAEDEGSFGNSGMGIGIGIGLERGVDRGLGIPYDDEDEANGT